AFVASTYKRGIPFVLVSTSLVGCVDAAIGGKAAVDLNNVKNPVGCFAAPEAVILDLRALSTLPASCVSEGLVEAYKTGLVANPELAALIETNMGALLRRDLLLLGQVVRLSASAKAEIVGKDFRESGLRRILNFGHTFGHAVESFNNYRISHGTAVAAGMIIAMALSENRGMISSEKASGIQSILRNLVRGPVRMPTADDAWMIMMNDKKNRDGRVNFVLLSGIGSSVCVDDVQPKELTRAISSIEGLPNE
ncbi:MAG: 3-dehydroquinate synthase, partial [Deltaproteobacteria bacterium]|nr:3-dehydroquinate synthase [Deltaproteobacteria bacterium]